MISHSERAEPRKVTIEDLLRLKRAERPAAEFWQRFEEDLRAKQLAAIIEKRPWWVAIRLPQITRSVARFQVPVGVAAVLALSFFVMREYRPVEAFFAGDVSIAVAPVLDVPVLGSPISAGTAPVVTDVETHSVERTVVASLSSKSAERDPSLDEDITPSSAYPEAAKLSDTAVASGGLMAMIPWAVAVSPADSQENQRALVLGELPQAHFASAIVSWRDYRFESQMEIEPVVMPVRVAVTNPATMEPSAPSLSPSAVRRHRILSDLVVADNMTEPDRSRMGQVREVLASALDDDRLYDSVRRLGMGGDRLTLKF